MIEYLKGDLCCVFILAIVEPIFCKGPNRACERGDIMSWVQSQDPSLTCLTDY